LGLNRLLRAFNDDPKAVLDADSRSLAQIEGVRPSVARSVAEWRSHVDIAREEANLARSGASFLVKGDKGYPRLLREIHDPPIGLYKKGPCEPGEACIAVVGSRRTTSYGLGVARRFGGELAKLGFCVVSGLARGIDTAAHEGALEAGGRTVAVLGTGIDRVYPPENGVLQRRIAEAGALLSELPCGRAPNRQTFPMRNRIVSGLCEATIVVESDVDGGAMITARLAAEQGRTVFAVPGRIDQPTSAGCHQLIREGAALLRGMDDILSELSYLKGFRRTLSAAKPTRLRQPSEIPGLSRDERSVLDWDFPFGFKFRVICGIDWGKRI
jgi:DNA processing protein